MSSEPVVTVNGLSKCYQVYDKPSLRLKQSIASRIALHKKSQAQKYYREFWALRDINFSVRPGESIGIVGRNGSGKSTLLQIICGTLAATEGSVSTRGRIAALLELGSAFNPEFTGRENVFMNAAVLGFKESETKKKFDEILDFADIGEFIDQPVKAYSSGMRLRLAFAVQAQLEPDILIVDEALAVGDARFQAKCFARLHRLKEAGTSILLVTHATEQVVTHCDNAILLDRGSQLQIGEPRQVVNEYLDLVFGRAAPSPAQPADQPDGALPKPLDQGHESDKEAGVAPGTSDRYSSRPNYNKHEYRWGDKAARLIDFRLSADGVMYPSSVITGSHLELQLDIQFDRPVVRPILGITIKSKEGVTVFGTNTERLNCEVMRNAGSPNTIVTVVMQLDCRLNGGDYFVSAGLASRGAEGVIPHDRRYDSIHLNVEPNSASYGLVDMNVSIQTEVL